MIKHSFKVTFVVAIALFAGACAKPPTEAVDAARAALDAAQVNEADRYVSDMYLAAADSFSLAQTEIETQNAKNALTRNYDRAAALLAFVSETAAQAQTQVATAKEAVRVSNEELFVQVDAAIAQANELLSKAPRGKDGAVALASIREDVVLTGGSIEEARAAQAAGDFLRARDVAQSAFERANGLIEELNTAIAAVGGRRS